LTYTYFEGRKLHSHLAMFGNSKEKHKDARLVNLALVAYAQGCLSNTHQFWKGRFKNFGGNDCRSLKVI
jgi:hypothetical protein